MAITTSLSMGPWLCLLVKSFHFIFKAAEPKVMGTEHKKSVNRLLVMGGAPIPTPHQSLVLSIRCFFSTVPQHCNLLSPSQDCYWCL